MNCPICEDLQQRIQYIQQAITYYQEYIQYNEDRINYLIFVGVNRIGQRPHHEYLSVVQRLHQQYTNLLTEVEQIQAEHYCYHPNTL